MGLLSSFTDRSFYSSHFMDLPTWEPYVRQLCQQHGLVCLDISPGVPGSYPTFIVELDPHCFQPSSHHVVMKFFGPLFGGGDSFRIERAMGHWLQNQSLTIHSPQIFFDGQLEADWWYLVQEYIPGVPVAQVRDQLSPGDWQGIARQLGKYLGQLHRFSPSTLTNYCPASETLPGWEGFAGFLTTQREKCFTNHQLWQDLPDQWLEQLEAFVLPVDRLIDTSAPSHFIHADLTADHLLGRFVDGRWQTLAIIDWGDAMPGNILYELVALYLDLFHSDKVLLNTFLDTYPLAGFFHQDFPCQALSMSFLHQFPMPGQVYAPYTHLPNLQVVAECLYPRI